MDVNPVGMTPAVTAGDDTRWYLVQETAASKVVDCAFADAVEATAKVVVFRALVSTPPTPPPPTVVRSVRRMRQSPHLSDEQAWLFFTQFQLDLEVGLGLTDGQGLDPQVMLQWSNDSGHTWSEEVWVSAGRLGQYKFRAIWRRLGRGRQRTWRIVVADPIAWRLLDAFVQVEKGTS
jgi:hypothetical protein